MYTKCPHCQTCFRVAEAHLEAAKGKVRCGSCKEIFDATEYLYDGVPGAETTTRIKHRVDPTTSPTTKTDPAGHESIVATPQDCGPAPRFNEILPGGPEIPEHEHQHIDLSVPPDRSHAPDQSPFMESLIGESSHYNKLDDMASIDIPGEADFTESFIRFADNDPPNKHESDPSRVPGEPASIINPYQDNDALEAPATTQDRAGIEDLYNAADNQMHDLDAEQIDQHIEALLAGDLAFDDDKTTEQPERSGKKPDVLTDLADQVENITFDTKADIPLQLADEPQLVPRGDEIEPAEVVSSEDIWSKKSDPEKNQQADDFSQDDISQEKQSGHTDINLDDFLDSEFNNSNSEPDIDFDEFLDSDDGKPLTSDTDANEFEVSEFETPEVEKNPEPETKITLKSISSDSESDDLEDELPSMDHEIPKALRSSFENYTPPIRPIGVTMAMIAAMVILIIALLGQTILFRSYQLANQLPSLSPILSSLCGLLPCRYSGSIDTTKIEVLNRDMRSHPNEKNALLVSTAFVNNAQFDQPYPIIAIKLFDLSGDTVATRYFKPEEYLEDLYSKFLLMESGTPVHVTLAILDPGDDAVNFEFSFL